MARTTETGFLFQLFCYNSREPGGKERVSRKDGLTLIELVITLAVVAVLTVLFVPNLGRWVSHYRLRGAVREIVSQMELAKIKALKSNLEYRILFDLEARTFELQRGDRPDSSLRGSREGGLFTLPTQVQVREMTFRDSAAEFNPHGTAAGGRVVLVSRGGEEYRITVNTTTGKTNTTRVK
jgi:prepilin-type N-terminal cleavage/methylation domain-containing protein